MILVRVWKAPAKRDVRIIVVQGCKTIVSITFDGVEQLVGLPVPAEVFWATAPRVMLGRVEPGVVMRVFAEEPGEIVVVAYV